MSGFVGIQDHFVDSGILADLEKVLPALPAVGGLEEAPLSPCGEERTLGRDIDHVGIPGIQGDHPDVLGILRGHLLPGLPGIGGFEETLPKWALRWLRFSPVPSHTTSESLGSTTTQQVVKAAPS